MGLESSTQDEMKPLFVSRRRYRGSGTQAGFQKLHQPVKSENNYNAGTLSVNIRDNLAKSLSQSASPVAALIAGGSSGMQRRCG